MLKTDSCGGEIIVRGRGRVGVRVRVRVLG